MLEITNTTTEMMLISKLGTAKERIIELEDISQ